MIKEQRIKVLQYTLPGDRADNSVTLYNKGLTEQAPKLYEALEVLNERIIDDESTSVYAADLDVLES